MKKIFLPLMALPLIAAAPIFPDRAGRGVVDEANVLPDAEEAALNEKVVAWEKKTHHQLAVVTVPDMQGNDIKDYANQMFRSYGLGRKEQNDGVLLLLAMKERKVRIEVGYGLEDQLPDGTTFLIIKEAIVPELKSGDVVGAMNIGVDNIIANVKPEDPAAPAKKGGNGWFWLVLGGLGLLGAGGTALWVSIRAARRREEEEERARKERQRIRDEELQARRRARQRDGVLTPPRYVKPTPPYNPTPMPVVKKSTPRRERERDTYVAPVYVPTPTPTPTPSSSYDWGSSSSSSSDSSSSSSYDSGGGSSGGGGSDSSW